MIFGVLLFLLLPSILAAESLTGEFWLRDDISQTIISGKSIQDIDIAGKTQEEAINSLLEDARWAYSGMIYGFEVIWTPSSKAREVPDTLIISPVALIPRGDARFMAIATVVENGFFYIALSYHLDEIQEVHVSAWNSRTLPFVAGYGHASISDDSSRRKAIEAAIKESLRAYLRAREFNRPYKVKGRIGLLDFPVISLVDSTIVAKVKLAVDLLTLVPYRVD